MVNTYDYESNPQPGDMPYDQAEQAEELAYHRLASLRRQLLVQARPWPHRRLC